VIAAGGMTATFGVALSTPAEAASASDFARLRMCESGGNYAINTGNGYYGAYQFDLRTWRGLGYSGRPSDARPATQDVAAERLQAARGWQPWPACARKLGLGGDSRNEQVRASRSHRVTLAKATRPAVTPTAAPAFSAVLTTALVGQDRGDVRAWQSRMAARGWDIDVDGRFGPQSAHVAARFAAEKGLKVTPGTVNKRVWNAAWQLRVS
jgi:hypothetical protein